MHNKDPEESLSLHPRNNGNKGHGEHVASSHLQKGAASKDEIVASENDQQGFLILRSKNIISIKKPEA